MRSLMDDINKLRPHEDVSFRFNQTHQENNIIKELESNPYFVGGFEEKITVEEALLILGISEEDAKDHKKLHGAHRKVMLKNHPDKGGSLYLASKINEARDLLLSVYIKKGEE
eukprot:TRINITY_DN6537_c0_g1_i2.p1 TRINITY_DN6537_c0_g1~~TRINITY_DN6537_c0_g1_i2.p1  ORF type:complete len:113 (-),score=26.60 TRINITY_DN6537_c0_g1_i2:40-378(-)